MKELVEYSKELLTSGKVNFIIGYCASGANRTKPFIARNPQEAEKLVFNNQCVNNLAVYLTRFDAPKEGKVGIVAKGCDIRSIVQLIQESQIERDKVFIIGMNCNGVVKDLGLDFNGDSMAAKCVKCNVHEPKIYDVVLGEVKPTPQVDDKHILLIQKIDNMTPAERWQYWQDEFAKCIRCYACRQTCPIC